MGFRDEGTKEIFGGTSLGQSLNKNCGAYFWSAAISTDRRVLGPRGKERTESPCSVSRLALESALRNLPDLILLYINMPEMDGFEVCRRLKADENSLPSLFCS
jgi:CheY-like chemotaxis protein